MGTIWIKCLRENAWTKWFHFFLLSPNILINEFYKSHEATERFVQGRNDYFLLFEYIMISEQGNTTIFSRFYKTSTTLHLICLYLLLTYIHNITIIHSRYITTYCSIPCCKYIMWKFIQNYLSQFLNIVWIT